MKRFSLLPRGIIARMVGILLVTLVIEFAVSTIIYEQASEVSVREDEARRLAEHLVIAHRLVSEQPRAARAAMVKELTTERYRMSWSIDRPQADAGGEPALRMRRQIIAWEPTLASTGLSAQPVWQGGSTIAVGSMQLPDGDWLHFRTAHSLQPRNEAYVRVFSSVLTVAALMLIGGLFIRQTLQPIRSLTDAVNRFGPGLEQLKPDVDRPGDGDVKRLIEAFDAMQARIRQLIDERTRALAAVSHDLRTPLARLRLRVEAVDDSALRQEVEQDLHGMEAMITSLLTFLGGDGDTSEPRLIDLAVVCASIVDDAADHGHEITYEGPSHFAMNLRAMPIRRAVVNLVENAVRYGSHVTLRLSATATTVAITVEDDGPGIPEASLALVREPFVRLDQARQRDTSGFGLGLAIVDRAVADEGGSLTLTNRPGGGLSATICLPAAKTSPGQ